MNWATSWQNQQNDSAPSEDSDQPGHPPSLIRVFAVRVKKACVLSYPLSAERRLWSDWADAQADLSLRWAHSHYVGFDMRRLNLSRTCIHLLRRWWTLWKHFLVLAGTRTLHVPRCCWWWFGSFFRVPLFRHPLQCNHWVVGLGDGAG